MRFRSLLVLAVLSLACPQLAWPQQTDTLTIVTDDYAFKGPDHISAGLTTIEVVNQGQTLHHVQLVKLPANKTLSDLFAVSLTSCTWCNVCPWLTTSIVVSPAEI